MKIFMKEDIGVANKMALVLGSSTTGLDETLVSVSISRISRFKFLVSVSPRSRKVMFESSQSHLGLEITILENSRSRLGLEITILDDSRFRLGLAKFLKNFETPEVLFFVNYFHYHYMNCMLIGHLEFSISTTFLN